MDKHPSQHIRRRQFLIGTGAAMMQSAMPMDLHAAPKRKKMPGGTIQSPNNPFFLPVGPPLPKKGPLPKPIKGRKVTEAEPSTRTAGAETAIAAITTAALAGASGARAATSGVLGVAAGTLAATDAFAQTPPSPVLILYDTTGQWGWLGELYAIMVANLVSHFGTYTAMPVLSYTPGTLNNYSAAIYIGSTYDEPVPVSFLDDAYGSTRPVIWVYDNIWQLTARQPSFPTQYGWNWSGFDYSSVAQVNYKSQSLKRYAPNGGGIMNYASVGGPATVLANCVRSDGTTFPWAIRSRNLTYIGENPLTYISEGDRYLIFCDLLFDALAPTTVERHRAIVRLEDINPTDNPTQLRNTADWLKNNNVPFAFQTVPVYKDPGGEFNGGAPVNTPLRNRPSVINALKYMQTKGGIQILHGYTHQYSSSLDSDHLTHNPFNGVTGDDSEFYRVYQNADLTLNYASPVLEDSPQWVTDRFALALNELAVSGFAKPTMHTSPHYASSANTSKVASSTFAARYERTFYFRGLLSGGTIDHTRVVGQYFPYTVRDLYYQQSQQANGKVIPENLGSVEPEPFGPFPTRFPADIIADAKRLLVVRDGVASFFYHPFLGLSYLQQTVNGLKSLGYTFVSQASL